MIQRVKMDALHDWAFGVTGIKTVWMNQRAPRPPNPYCALEIIAGPNKVGGDNLRQEAGGQLMVSGMRYYTLSVNTYGNNANELAHDLITSLEMPSVQEQLRKADIAIVEHSDIRVLDQLLETDQEGRAQFDFRFATSLNKIDDGTGWIEHVALTDEEQSSTTVVNP